MSDAAAIVHPQWARWAAENLAGGADPTEIIHTLVEEGAGRDQATSLVEQLRQSPAMAVATGLRRRVRALETMLRLRRENRSVRAAGSRTLDRVSLPSIDDFLARYWVPGTPVIIDDLVPAWPAFGRWSFADLVDRFGDVEVEASMNRGSVAMPDADWEGLRQTLPLRELVHAMLDPSTGNEVYVIAKNAILRNPNLAGLLEDVTLPPEFFGDRLDPMRSTLWLGPAGTHTPLHHDGDNAMFCQVVGRKRVRLAPAESVALLDRSDGVYCRWDPQTEAEVADGPETLIECELQPGEALFLPAGWWHQIDALEPSMSVSILHFVFDNDYSWYKPGSILRGSHG